jgi:hypothetical protein
MKSSDVKWFRSAYPGSMFEHKHDPNMACCSFVRVEDHDAFAKEAEEEYSAYVQECNKLHSEDNEKIKKAERERDAHKLAHEEIVNGAMADLNSQLVALQSRLDEAVKALEKYGDHDRTCSIHHDVPGYGCNCGFSVSISNAKAGGAG